MEYSDYPVHAWSRSRHRMRAQCPRKAVLFCRDARAGADPLAERMPRLLHEYRNRITLDAYMYRSLHDFVRQAFYTFTEDGKLLYSSISALAGAMQNRFDRELERMLYGGSSYDHKLFFLRELEDKNCRIPALMERAAAKISDLCAALEKNLWQLIVSTPGVSRRHIASPLAVYINDLCCYCAPVLALERNGDFWTVEFNGDGTSALLHKFYGINTLGRDVECLRSFSYDVKSGDFFETGLELSVSAQLERIAADGAAWAELLSLPTEQIPGNTAHCGECEFYRFCQKYYPNQGGDVK